METVLLKKGFWSTLILLSSLLLSALTFSKSVSAHNHVLGHRIDAVIYSDRSDYQPGDTLRLSGSGFQPGETVTLHFDETPTVCTNGHNRFAIADTNGDIFYDQFYFNDRHLGVTFIVTATGQSSGLTAQTTFTDGLLFTATISSSPSPVCSGGSATYTMVITNLTTAPPTGNNARLGSVRIVIPSGYSSVSISSISLPTRFSAGIVAGNIQVSRTGGAGNSLSAGSPGESLTIVFTATAPSTVSNPYVFTTTAWVGNDFATTQYPALVSQPQVSLNAGPIITVADLPTSGIIANQAGTCGASVTLGSNVSATGNPTPSISYSLTNFGSVISNPYVFPVGTTAVYAKASNDCGSDIKSFTVTVTDNEVPVAPVLSDVTGQCSATASAPTATDNCEGAILGTTSDPLSYSTQGTHVIHWIFDDGNGNVSYADQNVIIDDTIAPAAPLLLDVTGQCSATASAPTATDNCEGAILGTTSDPLSYSTQGTHVIHWSFDDGNGNVSSADQNVIIDDTIAPAAPVLSDVTGQCSATASAPTATDNCEGAILGTTSDPLSYSTQGTHVIHWIFDDGNGNVSSADQNVIIDDTIAPAAPVLSDVTGQCSATASAPTATDNCEGAILGTTSDPLSYSTQGTHVIHWSFDDGNGNVSYANQNVIIDDVTAPAAPVLADVTGECSAEASAPSATDNCEGSIQGMTSDPLSYSTQGTHVIHWSFDDGNGNVSYANQNVIIDDVTAPAAPVLADVTGECSAEASAPSATDNCEGSIQGTTSDPLSYSTQGTHVIHWSFDDGNGNVSYADQNVIIDDVTEPSIACPSNIVLSACQSTATWSIPVALDNCDGAVVTQTSGPPSGSEFANGTTTTIGYKVTDAGGNEKTCSFTVTRQNTLSATCTNSNNILYYGYTGDQTSTITVNPSGGAGPYTVSITMNRPLKCNVITNSGDEVWNPGANTSANNGISCPASGSPAVNPVSTSTNTIISSLGYSVNVTLMADATFTATVTDANGCTVTCTTPIFAEDVRCFAGNSGVPKVKLCHKTGSTKNPCVNICVDESAVAEHMAHGDFFGSCTSNCQPAGGNTRPDIVFDVIAYPNPAKTQFTFEIETVSKESISIELYDISGRLVRQIKDSDQTVITFGEDLPRGLYLAVVHQGTEQKTLRVIKE